MSKIVPPHLRCAWDIPVASAVQAIERGEATPQQQKEFLNWLINHGCLTYDDMLMDSDRNSAFANGRRFVGLAVVMLLKVSTNALIKATKKP